jgi:hypothetical protein
MECLSRSFLLLIVYFCTCGIISFAGFKLRTKNGSDIRIIFYFQSLAIVATALLTAVAVGFGAIDKSGAFQGAFGKVLQAILHEFIVIDNGVYAFAGLSALITVPQVLNYVLSGLIFGVATAPIFTERSLGLIVLGIVKSTAVASGILLSLAISGGILRWRGMDGNAIAAIIGFSLLLLMLSFVTAMQYRDASEIGKYIKSRINPATGSLISKIHRTMTRKQSRPSNGIWDA